jgi:hypothetical protein
MVEKDSLRELPKNFGCAYCGMQFQYDQAIQNARPEPKKGDLTVCSSCGNINKLGVFGLEKVTQAELSALDPQSKILLAQAKASVAVQQQQKN